MPPEQTPTNGAKEALPGASIDLGKVLLPDPELHTPGNAQRANAGELLAQEQKAAAAPPPPPPAPLPKPAAKNPSSINPLETFQGDIQGMLGGQEVSAVAIAAAQAKARSHPANPGILTMPAEGQAGPVELEDENKEYWVTLGRRIAFIAGGILLAAAAAGVVTYAVLRPTSVAVHQAAEVPFISVDDAKALLIGAKDSRTTVMEDLMGLKHNESLTPGLIASFVPALASTSPSVPAVTMTAQKFLPILAPTMPEGLLRGLGSNFLIGVHSFNNANQSFLIITANNYEQGFAGMLAWEATMAKDLAPFFPSMDSTSSPQASTQIISSSFTDQVIGNHDARVLLDQSGQPVLLWAFLDRQTIVITTNQYTLGEIISRLKTAPVTPVPGQ